KLIIVLDLLVALRHQPIVAETELEEDLSRKDWWKPLPEEERPVTPKPAWTIPSSTVSDVENNWATALVSAYETPAENSLLAKTEDMTNFLELCLSIIEQDQECHKMLTDQVDWTNPEGDQVRVDVSRPLPLGGPPGHVTIQTQFFFNKDLEYLRYDSKGNSPALSISMMKAASYPDFVKSTMRILSVVRITAYSRYGYDYLSKIVLRRANLQEHTIAEKDFKNLYPSDFEDLNLLLLQDFQLDIESYQTQLNLTKLGWDATDVENNWATALVFAYETPAENSLLAKTEDMTNFPELCLSIIEQDRTYTSRSRRAGL
nr:hypothetical protein [Tanacetum cinerariifolium]